MQNGQANGIPGQIVVPGQRHRSRNPLFDDFTGQNDAPNGGEEQEKIGYHPTGANSVPEGFVAEAITSNEPARGRMYRPDNDKEKDTVWLLRKYLRVIEILFRPFVARCGTMGTPATANKSYVNKKRETAGWLSPLNKKKGRWITLVRMGLVHKQLLGVVRGASFDDSQLIK